MIAGIIVINPEMTQQDLISLKTQLNLNEVITGEQFDERVKVDPTYHRQVYMLSRRILVVRQDIDSCDRDHVDFILSLRNALVEIRYVRHRQHDPFDQKDGYHGHHQHHQHHQHHCHEHCHNNTHCNECEHEHEHEHGCWHEHGLQEPKYRRPHVLVAEGSKENPFIDHWYEGPPPYGPFRREMIEQWDWDHHIVRDYPWQSAYQGGGSALNPFGQPGLSEKDGFRHGQIYPLERITIGTLYYHRQATLGGNIGPRPGSAAQFHDPYIPWWKKGPLP